MKKFFAFYAFMFCLGSLYSFGQRNSVKFDDIKPGMHDKHIEALALEAANKRAAEYHWHESYTRVAILSPKWDTVFGKNGAVKERKIHAALFCAMDDGHCGITDFTFKQKLHYEGIEAGFPDNLLYDSNNDVYYAECE